MWGADTLGAAGCRRQGRQEEEQRHDTSAMAKHQADWCAPPSHNPERHHEGKLAHVKP